jgi:predicted Rossmann fold nucleotide-binding protein DprA/Smf involved in DNA uptake
MSLPSTVPRRLEIISGGQTGVDRGALDAALESGAPCGGWCPDGRRAEDGVIPTRYPLMELAGAGYPERTRRNVVDSDGTVILHHGPLSSGTLLTLETCEELLKPVCLIDGDENRPAQAAKQVREFIAAQDIQRLNVAGPRASHWPGAHQYAQDVIRLLLSMT